MTPEQIRLEALRLAVPNTPVLTRDDKLILDRARQYEEYITGPVPAETTTAAPRKADKRQGS